MTLQPTANRLLVRWIPTMKVGSIHMPESERDYHNTDSVKMFKVVAAGPGHYTRKGVFVPNEIKAGDNVIVDSRISGRPEEVGDNQFIIKNPEVGVIAVCPVQAAVSDSLSSPATVECSAARF